MQENVLLTSDVADEFTLWLVVVVKAKNAICG